MTDKKIDVKEIGNYKTKFKTHFDRDKGDFLTLDISISDDLKKLLNNSVIDEETEFGFDCGTNEYQKLKRYRVKSWIFNSLVDNYKDLLFTMKLLKNGEMKLKVQNVSHIDSIIDGFKQNLKQLIQTILKYSDIDMVVNFNVQN